MRHLGDIGLVYTFRATRNGISLARREQRSIYMPPPHVVFWYWHWATPAHGNGLYSTFLFIL
jgi:hypothetical protein